MKYARIVAEFCGRTWALPEETLMAMVDLLTLQAAGTKWSVDEIRERIDVSNAKNGYLPLSYGEARFVAQDKFDDAQEDLPMRAASGKRNAAAPGSVAVIPIMGIISQRMTLMSQISGAGGTSIDKLTSQFRQAMKDTNCKAIVFDVDSPGGSVNGVAELAAEIFNARKQKPIIAVSNSMAASAAYWLASAASEIVCTATGLCGSIGVFAMLQEQSELLKNEGIKVTIIKAGKYKAEGDPSQPLSDDAQAFIQSQVNDVYSMFVKSIAQQRGASQAAVRDGYGQGRALLGSEAVKQGLADRVGTMDDVLGKYGVKTSSQFVASESQPAIETREEKLNARVNPDDQPNDSPANDSPCGCTVGPNAEACKACQSCDNDNAPPKADGEMGCACACDACDACDGKAAVAARAQTAVNLASRRRQLHLL
jgi:signal peptide peptidase SppA